jgi:predicted ATPase/DNA-binding SARP family transcriptional activator
MKATLLERPLGFIVDSRQSRDRLYTGTGTELRHRRAKQGGDSRRRDPQLLRDRSVAAPARHSLENLPLARRHEGRRGNRTATRPRDRFGRGRGTKNAARVCDSALGGPSREADDLGRLLKREAPAEQFEQALLLRAEVLLFRRHASYDATGGSMNDQRPAQRTPKYRILGPLEAEVDGRQLALGPPKQRALLVALLMRCPEAVPVERLIDELWPENPPETARHAIHVYVSRLRRLIDPPSGPTQIVANSRAYELRVEPEAVDLARFQKLVQQGRLELPNDPLKAATVVDEALCLWRGRALADLDGEAGVRDVVLELEELRRDALELQVKAELASGRTGQLVPKLERLLGTYPAHEEFRAQLMLALYRSGRQQDALEEYGRTRQALLHELGLEPGPRLRELQAAILRQDPALIVEPPELRARRHLPGQPNAFVGRERELADLTELLGSRDARLVTLTGPGGIGKTRLAIAAADRLASRFSDGVFFASLVDIQTPDLIEPTIARALDVQPDGLRPLQRLLLDRLQDRELLLLVDNFEHVVDGASLVSSLLKELPRLKVLVTSRVRLNLYGEALYEVPPLSLPNAGEHDPELLVDSDAIALFTVRAREVQFNFELSRENTSAVSPLCRALEGLPLAIELAAARVDALGPETLLERLGDRLELLAGGPRDVAHRQRTLRATIAWSYHLLPDSEQALFRRLSVFAGGFSRDAGETVCGATRASLASLTAASLLAADRGRQDRLTMLATIRAYGLEQLQATSEADEMRSRHSDYYAELVEGRAPENPEALVLLEAELDNFRVALDWLYRKGDAERAAKVATALFPLAERRGHPVEGRAWLQPATDHPDLGPTLRANALYRVGLLAVLQSDLPAAAGLLDRSLALFRETGDDDQAAKALAYSSWSALRQGDEARAKVLATEAVQTARPAGAEALIIALTALGNVSVEVGETAEARSLFEESLSLARSAGDRRLVSGILMDLAAVDLLENLAEDALTHGTEALDEARASGDSLLVAGARVNIGFAHMLRGQHEPAFEFLIEGFHTVSAAGDVRACSEVTEALAALAAQQGELEDAARLAATAESLRRRVGGRANAFERLLWRVALSRARSEIGATAWDEAVDVDRLRSVAEALSYVQSVCRNGSPLGR